MGLVLVWISSVFAQIKNGDFEASVNTAWLTVEEGYPGLDAPVISRDLSRNHFGHVGDRDGRGNNGKNPSRILQSFACEDPANVSCGVTFRYKAMAGEAVAYVTLATRDRTRAWRIPNTAGQWSGPACVTIEASDSVTVLFGLVGRERRPLSGYLSVDDVRVEGTTSVLTKLDSLFRETVDSLSISPPAAASIIVVRDLSTERQTGHVSGRIGALVVASILLIFGKSWKKWRSQSS